MSEKYPRRCFLRAVVGGVAATAVVGLADCGGNSNSSSTSVQQPKTYDVTAYGARGDGATLDTPAINNAIQAAAAAGGGTVVFPAGNYLCYSIHLQSNVTLQLNSGATIIGADPATDGGPGYDPPEPGGDWTQYQDYLHNYYHDSLIWGVGLQNVSILGPGRIWGRGLDNGGVQQSGVGNKAIALKSCSNVTLRDFSVLHGGGDAIKALGTDNLSFENLVIDTNRGGIDVDCSQHVTITNCSVNSPNDDAICLKSSFALGFARVTQDVNISNCTVSGGYVEGTVLDGTRQLYDQNAPVARVGRIKFGTESNGGFQNVTISDCKFDTCWGLVLASVDGAVMQDINISNLTMTDLRSCPVFVRLGARLRGPANTPVGAIRRVTINGINAVRLENGSHRSASIISGIPGHSIEDITLSNIVFQHPGGGAKSDGSINPPENIDAYPDVYMFGDLPAHAVYARHIDTLKVSGLDITTTAEDDRPSFNLSDVQNAQFVTVQTPRVQGIPTFVLHAIDAFSLSASPPLPDTTLSNVQDATL